MCFICDFVDVVDVAFWLLPLWRGLPSGYSADNPLNPRKLSDNHSALVGRTFRDSDSHQRKMAVANILVVTTYDAQVNLLMRRLPLSASVTMAPVGML